MRSLELAAEVRVIQLNDITGSLVTMTDFVRRLVSGDKARFKDEKLDLELGEPHKHLHCRSTLNVGWNLN